MKLLVIDSDRDLVEMVTSCLRARGYMVYRGYDLERAKQLWIEQKPDMVLVDTALEETDVLEECQELRAKHDTYIIVITLGKDIHDEVRCLEAGADDYLRKPFLPSQLLARIHAVSRRSRFMTIEKTPGPTITVGPLCVDSLHNEVRIHDHTFRLTRTECKLLYLLAINANTTCTASQIVSHVWGYEGNGDVSLIKAHIHHLRQKIEPYPSEPCYILNVPGVGYKLVRRPAPGNEDVKDELRLVVS